MTVLAEALAREDSPSSTSSQSEHEDSPMDKINHGHEKNISTANIKSVDDSEDWDPVAAVANGRNLRLKRTASMEEALREHARALNDVFASVDDFTLTEEVEHNTKTSNTKTQANQQHCTEKLPSAPVVRNKRTFVETTVTVQGTPPRKRRRIQHKKLVVEEQKSVVAPPVVNKPATPKRLQARLEARIRRRDALSASPTLKLLGFSRVEKISPTISIPAPASPFSTVFKKQVFFRRPVAVRV